MTVPLSRRRFTLAAAAGFAAASIPGARLLARGPGDRRVVCYTSADSVYARVVFAAFTKATGIRVDAVMDTEATKTTGLMQRLLTEHEAAAGRTRCDVWWSSEPFGTIRLSRAGVLAETAAPRAEEHMKPHGGWPAHLRAPDRTWYGFGSRARVFVYNTRFVEAGDAPRTLGGLLRPEFKGRIAIARPQFGTTRGHFAAVVHRFGAEAFERWLTALKANGVRVLDGNASVVAAVARGECRVGLTDTDDVFAGQRERWPVELAWERKDTRNSDAEAPGSADLPGMGSLLIPNTVALAKGGANRAEAAELVEYLLSPDAQRALAETDSRNMPVDPALREEFKAFAAPETAEPDLHAVADRVDEAMAICMRVLG
ncbi:MAG: extracellular solute-binding protein [Phycisphaeraceae bacterium]|nr:extracellular solute-binding protein [Phycisphaeraceae bacterium]